MSSITFQCTSCEADFDIDITALLERPTVIKCTNCGARPSSNRCHSFAQALDDMLSAMAGLRSKVQFEINLDTDELPPPYGPADDGGGGMGSLSAATGGGDDDDDEDEDDDDDEDFDDDDEDFDDDDDFEFDDDDDDDDDDLEDDDDDL